MINHTNPAAPGARPTGAATEAELLAHLERLPGAVVAFSGGVDSTMLLHACVAALGDRVLAVTAQSPSLPAAELQQARELARAIGVRHQILSTDELSRDGYAQNGRDRCYFCKTELFERVAEALCSRWPQWTVLYGAIADDFDDHRPGARAAQEHGVRAPLAELGWTKEAVRRYSREHGLATADKQSFACLSSRVPYGTAIDVPLLARIERAEDVLRAGDYRVFRVRHHGDIARIELRAEDLVRAAGEDRLRIVEGIRACGWHHVVLDLQGFRSGSMNEVNGE